MSVLISNSRYMFVVFDRDDQYYMTVTVGGVAQYDVTVRLSSTDIIAFQENLNLTIAMSIDVATRMSAYEERIVRPSIDPS